MSDEKKDVTEDEEKVDSTDEESDEESTEKDEASTKTGDEESSGDDGDASDDEESSSGHDDEEEEAEEEAEDEEAEEEEEAEDEEAEEEEEAEDQEEAEDEEEAEDQDEEEAEDDIHEKETVEASRAHDHDEVLGVAAFFDHPDHLMYAAEQTRDSDWEQFDAYSPFPIHGMDDAMGLSRSWMPWVTFAAGLTGLSTASIIEFGIMGFDWPMVFGGKPYIAWPSFVPVMFELTVLFAGVTTAVVMLAAAGCFRKPLIIDPEITNDRFVLWISADDERFDRDSIVEFMKGLNPMEIRTLRKDA